MEPFPSRGTARKHARRDRICRTRPDVRAERGARVDVAHITPPSRAGGPRGARITPHHQWPATPPKWAFPRSHLSHTLPTIPQLINPPTLSRNPSRAGAHARYARPCEAIHHQIPSFAPPIPPNATPLDVVSVLARKSPPPRSTHHPKFALDNILKSWYDGRMGRVILNRGRCGCILICCILMVCVGGCILIAHLAARTDVAFVKDEPPVVALEVIHHMGTPAATNNPPKEP
jgi:hypothetical protein